MKVRKGGGEEIPLVQGKEQRLRFAGAAVKRHVLTKQEILLGKGTRAERSRVREPKRIALPCGSRSLVYGDRISFWVVFSQSF